MCDNPLVSIIIPVFNGADYISEAIKSCLNQTYEKLEVVIVNDYSTDKTEQIVKEYMRVDNRIVYFRNDHNLKLPKTLNRGHELSKGVYLTWLSHDNYLKINAIERLVETITDESCDIVYSDYSKVSESGQLIINKKLSGISNLLFGNFIGPSFLYSRSVYEANKGYDENLFLIEDHDFWIRSARHSVFFHLKENLYYYRVQNESLTSQIKLQSKTKELFRVANKLMFENFFKNMIYPNPVLMSEIFSSNISKDLFDICWIKKNKSEINSCLKNTFRLDELFPGSNHRRDIVKMIKSNLNRPIKKWNLEWFNFIYLKLSIMIFKKV